MSAVEQLREHFAAIPARQQATAWQSMWENKVTPWDRNKPNPALIETLQEKTDLLGKGTTHSRKRALIPGCGSGYDVLLFASHGYDAFGLDSAPFAIERAKELKLQNEREPGQYPVHDEELGIGDATYLLADFFEDTFLSETNGTKFDVIYDYTFLCALPPDLRPLWAKRMSDLLTDDGTLICVEFPLSKPPSSGGPPHGLSSELYIELLKHPGAEVSYDDDGRVKASNEQSSSTNRLNRIAHWRPARSHHVGQSTDMVSMWQRTRS